MEMSSWRQRGQARRLLFLALGGALLTWLSAVAIVFLVDDPARTGLLGDSFGAVNSLFTLFAVIGATVAVYYERLGFESDRLREAVEQRERRFFQLLELLRHTVQSLHLPISGDPTDAATGDRVFAAAITHAYSVNSITTPLSRIKDTNFRVFLTLLEPWHNLMLLLLQFVRVSPPSERQFFEQILNCQITRLQKQYLAICFQCFPEEFERLRKEASLSPFLELPLLGPESLPADSSIT